MFRGKTFVLKDGRGFQFSCYTSTTVIDDVPLQSLLGWLGDPWHTVRSGSRSARSSNIEVRGIPIGSSYVHLPTTRSKAE